MRNEIDLDLRSCVLVLYGLLDIDVLGLPFSSRCYKVVKVLGLRNAKKVFVT